MRYSPPLDGIRAIAILAVLIFHISSSALRGGFTGVDVFFVLSGFLITSIILHDLRGGIFSLREFYLRRVQRLLPNVVVTVLAVLLLWTIFMPPSAARPVARQSLWTIFDASNFYVWRYLGGYWGNAAEWSPLTHTWSLGVEEQFYLLFPGSLLLLAYLQPKRLRLWLIVAASLSFGLCVYVTRLHPTAAFYLLPTRIWQLLIGAALAAYRTPLGEDETRPHPEHGVNTREVIGLAGFGMIMLGFVLINDGSGFPGWVSIVPTSGALLILWSVADGNTRLARLLSTSPLVNTGKASYSIYLWHWPLITLGKALASLYGRPQILGAVAGGIAGVLFGWIAFAGVEQPLRRRGPGRSRRFAVIATLFSIAAVCSVIVMARRPVADPAHRFDALEFFGEQYTAGNAEGANEAIQSTRYYDVYFPPTPPSRPKDLWRTGGVVHLYGSSHPQVVVLGSSHALMYSKVIDDICRQMGISVAFLGVDATPIYFATKANFNFTSPVEAHEFDQARRKLLLEWHPDVVFLIDRWDGGGTAQQDLDKELHSLLTEVCPKARHVLFVSQIPAIRGGDLYNLRELVSWRMRKSNNLPLLYPDLNEPLRKEAVAVAEAETASFPNLSVLRADRPFYKEDGSIRYASGRGFYYADGDHLSEIGAEVLRGIFQSALIEAIPGSSQQTR